MISGCLKLEVDIWIDCSGRKDVFLGVEMFEIYFIMGEFMVLYYNFIFKRLFINIILYKERYYKDINENGRRFKMMLYEKCFDDLGMFNSE